MRELLTAEHEPQSVDEYEALRRQFEIACYLDKHQELFANFTECFLATLYETRMIQLADELDKGLESDTEFPDMNAVRKFAKELTDRASKQWPSYPDEA